MTYSSWPTLRAGRVHSRLVRVIALWGIEKIEYLDAHTKQMKKILLLTAALPLVILLSCNGPLQQNLDQTVAGSKTVQNPIGTEMPLATPGQLQHSFLLYHDSVVVQVNRQQASLPYDSVGVYMSAHKDRLTKQPLNIVVTEGASYRNIVDILDRMSVYQVKDFVLLRHP